MDYTGLVTYKVDGKKDTTWLGRFTFEALREFSGLSQILTILVRGFLFHGPNRTQLGGQPKEQIDCARRGCAPGAVCRSEGARGPSNGGRTLVRSTGSFRGWWTRMARDGSADTSTPP